jgi:hypothetical protein
MKKLAIIAAVAVIASATFLESCKKGENDPFLSFRSRKGRVAGEWKVSSGSGSSTNGQGVSSTWTFDGTTLTQIQGSNPSTTPYTIEYTFDKDGSFTQIDVTSVGQTTLTTTTSGTWNFTGKVGEDKNKDRIVMRTLSEVTTSVNPASTSTITYTGDDAPSDIMYIDQLKNKEIIFKFKGSQTSGNPATTDSNEGTYTLTAK